MVLARWAGGVGGAWVASALMMVMAVVMGTIHHMVLSWMTLIIIQVNMLEEW